MSLQYIEMDKTPDIVITIFSKVAESQYYKLHLTFN